MGENLFMVNVYMVLKLSRSFLVFFKVIHTEFNLTEIIIPCI